MDSHKNPYQSYYYSSQRRSASTGSPQFTNADGSPSASPPKRHRRRVFIKSLVLLVIIGIILLGAHEVEARHKDHPTKSTSTTTPVTHLATIPPPPPTTQSQTIDLTTLTNQINAIIGGNTAIDTSVSITDLTNGQTLHVGDDDAFTAASTTKLITACDFLQEVEKGQQSMNESVNGSTASYEIQQMIVVSDDNAWEALNDILGYDQIESYANTIGLASFDSETNALTSNDMATLLQKIYAGTLLNSSDNNLLLSYMKEANYRQYIIPAVPSSDTVYHKVGFYGDYVNDAAIITRGQQAIALVIFTNSEDAYTGNIIANLMQQITTDTLQTFSLN